ncbi:hypothetical protein AB3X91_16020 [Paraburkholderia sp. BR14263]|uniref:hypothetical protein n=1 Tax=unclassified Paraburkholderia TaxID=2615204 RepID=UPI0034CE4981
MDTIEGRWLIFRERCLHTDAPPLQVSEMRIAFYAGVQQMLNFNLEIADMPEHDAMRALERLHKEARHFGETLTREAQQ